MTFPFFGLDFVVGLLWWDAKHPEMAQQGCGDSAPPVISSDEERGDGGLDKGKPVPVGPYRSLLR